MNSLVNVANSYYTFTKDTPLYQLKPGEAAPADGHPAESQLEPLTSPPQTGATYYFPDTYYTASGLSSTAGAPAEAVRAFDPYEVSFSGDESGAPLPRRRAGELLRAGRHAEVQGVGRAGRLREASERHRHRALREDHLRLGVPGGRPHAAHGAPRQQRRARARARAEDRLAGRVEDAGGGRRRPRRSPPPTARGSSPSASRWPTRRARRFPARLLCRAQAVRKAGF